MFHFINVLSDNIHNLPRLLRTEDRDELLTELSYTLEFLSKKSEDRTLRFIGGTVLLRMVHEFKKYNVELG